MGPEVTRHRSPLASIARADYVNTYELRTGRPPEAIHFEAGRHEETCEDTVLLHLHEDFRWGPSRHELAEQLHACLTSRGIEAGSFRGKELLGTIDLPCRQSLIGRDAVAEPGASGPIPVDSSSGQVFMQLTAEVMPPVEGGCLDPRRVSDALD